VPAVARPRLFLRASFAGIALSALLLAGGARAAVPSAFPASGSLKWNRVAVRTGPSLRASRVAVLTPFRDDYSLRIVLALSAQRDRAGRMWTRISLPGRPNGRTGWALAAAFNLHRDRSLIVIHRASRRLELYRDDELVLRAPVVVGAPGRQTPLGYFYVTASFHPSNSFYGVWALETSAYSFLTDWPGGGLVGIHGTSEPQLLGQAASHGCVRVSNSVALLLKREAPLGTPIKILSS
jgi:lipoprotein-anchoring transpeptidase ErfK/SrfK